MLAVNVVSLASGQSTWDAASPLMGKSPVLSGADAGLAFKEPHMGTEDLAPSLMRRLSVACDGSDICDPFPVLAQCEGIDDICSPWPGHEYDSFVKWDPYHNVCHPDVDDICSGFPTGYVAPSPPPSGPPSVALHKGDADDDEGEKSRGAAVGAGFALAAAFLILVTAMLFAARRVPKHEPQMTSTITAKKAPYEMAVSATSASVCAVDATPSTPGVVGLTDPALAAASAGVSRSYTRKRNERNAGSPPSAPTSGGSGGAGIGADVEAGSNPIQAQEKWLEDNLGI